MRLMNVQNAQWNRISENCCRAGFLDKRDIKKRLCKSDNLCTHSNLTLETLSWLFCKVGFICHLNKSTSYLWNYIRPFSMHIVTLWQESFSPLSALYIRLLNQHWSCLNESNTHRMPKPLRSYIDTSNLEFTCTYDGLHINKFVAFIANCL